jgi:hypothetical protein
MSYLVALAQQAHERDPVRNPPPLVYGPITRAQHFLCVRLGLSAWAWPRWCAMPRGWVAYALGETGYLPPPQRPDLPPLPPQIIGHGLWQATPAAYDWKANARAAARLYRERAATAWEGLRP